VFKKMLKKKKKEKKEKRKKRDLALVLYVLSTSLVISLGMLLIF